MGGGNIFIGSAEGNNVPPLIELRESLFTGSPSSHENVRRQYEPEATTSDFVGDFKHSVSELNCRYLPNVKFGFQITEWHTRPPLNKRATTETDLGFSGLQGPNSSRIGTTPC